MVFHGSKLVFHVFSCFFMVFHGSRCEARHETYRTPKLVTTRRSILGLPAEGRPGPSDDDDDEDDDDDDDCCLQRRGNNVRLPETLGQAANMCHHS